MRNTLCDCNGVVDVCVHHVHSDDYDGVEDDTQHAMQSMRLWCDRLWSTNGLHSDLGQNQITSIASNAFSGLTALYSLFVLMIMLFRHSERVLCVINE